MCYTDIRNTDNIPNGGSNMNENNMNNGQGTVQFVPAKCTNCGGELAVDPSQECAICKYCGTPFIVANAVKNYNIQNNTYNTNIVNDQRKGTVESILNYASDRQDKKYQRQEEQRIRREEKQKSAGKTILWILGWLIIFPVPLTILMLRNRTMNKNIRYGIIAAGWIVYLLIGFSGRSRRTENEEIDRTVVTETTAAVEETAAETATAEEFKLTEDNFDDNEYFESVDAAGYVNSIGTKIIIAKILAKKNATVSSTMLLVDQEGNVLGKSTSEIKLTEGQYNYFRYTFNCDMTGADLTLQGSIRPDSVLDGERNAVEMVKYNKNGNDLFLTLRQTSDDLGAFAKFKILFYKNGKIVYDDEGYFNVYAQNLSGADSTDVAKIWAYGIDYDEIEYIFEP